MHRHLGRKTVALVVGTTLAATGAVAAFAASTSGGGGYQVSDFVTTSQRHAGKNIIFTGQGKLALTGSITGDAVITERGVVHKSGDATFHGVWTCASCTVDGKTGTVVTRFRGKDNSDGIGHGRFNVKGGGDLKGLRGTGKFADSPAGDGSGTYTLTYRYAKG